MPEAPKSEFWQNLKPIANSLKPDAQPEVFHQLAQIEDERYYAHLSETVLTRPLWINVKDNTWCDVLWAKEAGLVNRHYHPHEVFAYTISGKWGYLEQEWTATAGSFVYETPGEGHTLVAYESDEQMRGIFIVKGPLIWLDEDGNSTGHFDVHDYLALVREHYDKVGLGADLINQLIR
ncbi:MAG: 2,4'-dihydroxyacetophenone dioxygenase family protein [Segniliparus sp.]|uniref:2,4'-dihydroxyacetophenone dioxygenase family protein n=1 Tax=Segniliparus sp. TaxID=2804064 RepID=UPI003F3B8D2D